MSCRATRMLEPIPVSRIVGRETSCVDGQSITGILQTYNTQTLSTPDSHPLKLLIQIMFAQNPHIHPLAPSHAHIVFLKTTSTTTTTQRWTCQNHCWLTGSFTRDSERKLCLFYWCFRWRNASKNTRPSDPRTSSPRNCSTKLIRCRRDRHQTAIDTLEELSGAVSVLWCRRCCIFIAT